MQSRTGATTREAKAGLSQSSLSENLTTPSGRIASIRPLNRRITRPWALRFRQSARLGETSRPKSQRLFVRASRMGAGQVVTRLAQTKRLCLSVQRARGFSCGLTAWGPDKVQAASPHEQAVPARLARANGPCLFGSF